MTETDTRKVALGALLLAVSTLLIFGPATVATTAPAALITVGALGLAAGALLVGTSTAGRPV